MASFGIFGSYLIIETSQEWGRSWWNLWQCKLKLKYMKNPSFEALHSPLRSQSSIQGRESEKKSSNQQFRMAMRNFLIACEIKRSFNSCRTESRNEWKKFLTLCEISNTMRNQDATMKEFRIPCRTSHGMRNLLV